MTRSPSDILASAAQEYHDRPLFKIPRVDPRSGNITEYTSISYSQFAADVDTYARHWCRILRKDGVARGSVVGLWLGGFTTTDVLHIYGLSRAGYIPQLFSLRLPNPTVIYELLHRANAKALIFDHSYKHLVDQCPIPCHVAVGVDAVDPRNEPLPPRPVITAKDTLFIFHTSGSTSGSPKLVPCGYQWLVSTVQKSHLICRPRDRSRQDVTAWMGSMCHIAQEFMLIGAIQHGTCIVQPTKPGFDSAELFDMVGRCGLNRLNQFGSYLGGHLRNSHMDPKLLHVLKSLDDVLYTGLALPVEEERWAVSSGIKLRNLFGNTECGAMLLSVEGNPSLVKPLEGFSYRFVPHFNTQPEPNAHQSSGRLYELVILSDSPDCPAPSLRHADGHFHTGDLFREASNGRYIPHGRDDDWIKSENSLRCDTKSIEDHARLHCKALIGECIVVGSGRPSPAMFVEPSPSSANEDPERLRRKIWSRIREFHGKRYLHESLIPELIIIVPAMSLPRTATKGNVRRQAVEEAYKGNLDQLYASLATKARR
ncbi:acetyl-CoA synthetase-like protein [Pluteus cervinus]|uniref:Acetyl-CoA synthetase-like protein n=1 Tax=Pluteus cervinus TaxID=181527 RepID=A0ACD3B5H3_9AGAR|nr:acetyl-CoA synthetase-like protein [Pluteus cervinus]